MSYSIRKAEEKLGKIKWYKQGAAVRPLYFSYPCYSCTNFKVFSKKIKYQYEVIVFLRDNLMSDYISIRSLNDIASYYYGRQIKNNKFVDKLNNNWQKNKILQFLKSISDLLVKDFSGLDIDEVFLLFNNFTKIYLDLWAEVIFLDSFDYYGEKILHKAIKKENKNIKVSDLEVLLLPPNSSWLQKERLDLLKIAEVVDKNKNKLKIILQIKKYSEVIELFPKLDQRLKEHSYKYHWLHNDFASIVRLDSNYFFKNLILLLSDENKLKDEKRMRSYLTSLNFRKNKIIKKYKLSKGFTNITYFLASLGNLRDERKTYNQMAGTVLKKFAVALSEKSNLDVDLVENLFFWEIKKIFKLKAEQKKKIKNRSHGFLFFLGDLFSDKVEFRNQQAVRLNSYIDKAVSSHGGLKGMVAFRGVVKGRVKIVRDKSDFKKMKKGDVLVAPNTRPEYVPIMKIAAAIISEEGGITCHSAIVARELKIPCIVGVQGAIVSLKNGDKIEVDANKGVVKIIK